MGKEFQKPKFVNVAFDEEQGKIYRYFPSSIEVVRLGKPYPAYYIKEENNPNWQCSIPDTSFPFLIHEPSWRQLIENNTNKKYYERRLNIYNSIINSVGVEKARVINQFKNRQWLIYCLLFHCKEYGFELINSNPALTYLLSSHAVFHPLKSKLYWRSVRSLILKKRKNILKYFGFPANEATVRLFKKIPANICTIELLLWLRKRLKYNPELLRRFGFVSTLTKDSLMMILSPFEDSLSNNVINEVSQHTVGNWYPKNYIKLHDVFRMKRTLDNYDQTVPDLHFKKSNRYRNNAS